MTPLQTAAQALINSWESPSITPTSPYIAELSKALADEQAQAVEPNVRELNPTLWAFFHQLIHGDFMADNPKDLSAALAARQEVFELCIKKAQQVAVPKVLIPDMEHLANEWEDVATSREVLLASMPQLNHNNYTHDEVVSLCDWANEAADMLAADAKSLFHGRDAAHWHRLSVLRFQEIQQLEDVAKERDELMTAAMLTAQGEKP